MVALVKNVRVMRARVKRLGKTSAPVGRKGLFLDRSS